MDLATLLGVTPQPAGIPPTPAEQPVVQSVAAPNAFPAAPVPPATVYPVPPPAQVDQQPLAPLTTDATPQEKMGFFEKLRSDPNLTQSIMMMGLNMMQGPRENENFLGLAGRSGMLATQAKGFLDQSSVDQARQAAESASKLKAQETQTAAAQQQIDQRAQEFPETMRKLTIDIDNARTDGERKKAEAAMKTFESDPKRMAEKFDLDRAATRANINQSNAAAGASGASARASNALTSERQTNLQMRNWAANGTDEQKAQARQFFTVDDQGTNAAKDKNAFLATQMKNLGWDDQQIAQRLLDINDPTNAKGDTLRSLIFLANEEMDPTKKTEILGKIKTLSDAGLAKGSAPASAAPAASATPNMAAWEKARNSVAVGKTYVGPDGATYTRTK